MAKRKPTGKDNRQTMEHNSFRVDETITADPVWYRAVCDEIGHEKLDAILAALGGSSNTTATIYNVNIISAGSEQSQALPASTKNFLLRSRNKGKVQLAYTVGGSGTNFVTIPAGSSFVDRQFYLSQTIYFQSTKPGDVIEIIAYS